MPMPLSHAPGAGPHSDYHTAAAVSVPVQSEGVSNAISRQPSFDPRRVAAFDPPPSSIIPIKDLAAIVEDDYPSMRVGREVDGPDGQRNLALYWQDKVGIPCPAKVARTGAPEVCGSL